MPTAPCWPSGFGKARTARSRGANRASRPRKEVRGNTLPRKSAAWLAWLSGLFASYLATALLIACVALVFYFIPNTKVRFRDVWPGAILVGLLWRVAFLLFSWYAADLATWNVIHGSIAAVVVFLLWIYVSAVILIYGVEMTASYARLRQVSLGDAQPPGRRA